MGSITSNKVKTKIPKERSNTLQNSKESFFQDDLQNQKENARHEHGVICIPAQDIAYDTPKNNT